MRSALHAPMRRWAGSVGFVLALTLAAGCATTGRKTSSRRALKSVPQVPADELRADRAILAAFFSANGAPLSAAQLAQILPTTVPQSRMDRHALRNIARYHDRLVSVVKADETFLQKALDQNLPLLVFLPPSLRYHPTVASFIPVAWDLDQRTIELLDGNGEIQTISETDFFARREPLKNAALCLVKPGAMRRMEPTREQKLVLADFWFDQGFYRRAQAAYEEVQKESPIAALDVESLIGQGNVLVRKQRYEEAIPVYRAALAIEPDNAKILNNLAYCMLHGNGELLTALRHSTKADRLNPDNPIILETIGSINLRLGDAPTAARYLEQAWARALRRSPETQIAIMDQLVRAWLAADRQDLAWQVAECRQRVFPEYRFPKDILRYFPSLRHPPASPPKK